MSEELIMLLALLGMTRAPKTGKVCIEYGSNHNIRPNDQHWLYYNIQRNRYSIYIPESADPTGTGKIHREITEDRVLQYYKEEYNPNED